MSILRRAPARLLGRRVVPWLLVLDLLREGHAHWQDQLTPKERSRLIGLIKQSRGRPATLTPKERTEFHALAGQLDLVGFGKRAAVSTVGIRSARKKGRR